MFPWRKRTPRRGQFSAGKHAPEVASAPFSFPWHTNKWYICSEKRACSSVWLSHVSHSGCKYATNGVYIFFDLGSWRCRPPLQPQHLQAPEGMTLVLETGLSEIARFLTGHSKSSWAGLGQGIKDSIASAGIIGNCAMAGYLATRKKILSWFTNTARPPHLLKGFQWFLIFECFQETHFTRVACFVLASAKIHSQLGACERGICFKIPPDCGARSLARHYRG